MDMHGDEMTSIFLSQIEDKKLEWKAASLVGSLDNAKHRAGGGAKKVSS